MNALFFLLVACTFSAVSAADIHKCSDGVYRDTPCSSGSGTIIPGEKPGLKINITFTPTSSRYPVSGKTIQDAFRSFGRQGWAAYNTSDPGFTFTHEKVGKLCQLNQATITINNNHHLPQWTDYATATASERASWDRFLVYATNHEDGHRTIARENTVLVREKLAGIGPRPCEELPAIANHQMMETWTHLRWRQKEYDARAALETPTW